MAAPYDHYGYSAAKTNDFEETPNPHGYTEHIPEDESFNPASIPNRSKAYDDLPGNHDSLNHHYDEEQGYAMDGHTPPLHGNEDSQASLVHNAADTGHRYQDLGAAVSKTTRMRGPHAGTCRIFRT
jgi:hypothetical protein